MGTVTAMELSQRILQFSVNTFWFCWNCDISTPCSVLPLRESQQAISSKARPSQKFCLSRQLKRLLFSSLVAISVSLLLSTFCSLPMSIFFLHSIQSHFDIPHGLIQNPIPTNQSLLRSHTSLPISFYKPSDDMRVFNTRWFPRLETWLNSSSVSNKFLLPSVARSIKSLINPQKLQVFWVLPFSNPSDPASFLLFTSPTIFTTQIPVHAILIRMVV